jgi:hypothetical protein
MGRRGSYRYINRLKISAAETAFDPAHESRCRIQHAEWTSLALGISEHYGRRGHCLEFELGHCRDPVCRQWHAIHDYYGLEETGPYDWSDGHARRMNRVLWNELWALEHKVAHMRAQLARIVEPVEMDRWTVRRARRARKRAIDIERRDALAQKIDVEQSFD